jgi:hypothetical protein
VKSFFGFVKKRLRWFRVRKYEYVEPVRLIWHVFFLSVFSSVCLFRAFFVHDDCIVFFFSCFVFALCFCCSVLPFRLAFLMLFAFPVFVFLYVYLIYFFYLFFSFLGFI